MDSMLNVDSTVDTVECIVCVDNCVEAAVNGVESTVNSDDCVDIAAGTDDVVIVTSSGRVDATTGSRGFVFTDDCTTFDLSS